MALVLLVELVLLMELLLVELLLVELVLLVELLLVELVLLVGLLLEELPAGATRPLSLQLVSDQLESPSQPRHDP